MTKRSQHPNQIAALNRHRFSFGDARKCDKVTNGKRCGQPACSGSLRCRRHGGASRSASPPSPLTIAIREARRLVSVERNAGTIPPELLRQAVWQLTMSRRLVPFRPILISTWRSGDAAAWCDLVRQVQAAADAPPTPEGKNRWSRKRARELRM